MQQFISVNGTRLYCETAVVYVHCYRGIGRTGTVIGCYLVEQGTPDGWKCSPETEAQRMIVRTWTAFASSMHT